MTLLTVGEFVDAEGAKEFIDKLPAFMKINIEVFGSNQSLYNYKGDKEIKKDGVIFNFAQSLIDINGAIYHLTNKECVWFKYGLSGRVNKTSEVRKAYKSFTKRHGEVIKKELFRCLK